MTDTLLLMLAIIQVFVIFIYAGPIMARHLLYISLKKNPKWAVEHANRTGYKIADKLFWWFSCLLAAGVGAAIIQYAVINPTPSYFYELALVPTLIWVFGLLLLTVYVYGYLLKVIPSPEVVKANLISRRLKDYVPLWIFYLAYGLLGLICLYYCYCYSQNLIDIDALNQSLSWTFIIGSITLITLFYSLRRKHSEFDIMFAESGRKYEVMVNIIGIYIMVFVALNKMLIDIHQIEIFSQSQMSLILGLSVNVFFMWMATHPKSKEIIAKYKLKYIS